MSGKYAYFFVGLCLGVVLAQTNTSEIIEETQLKVTNFNETSSNESVVTTQPITQPILESSKQVSRTLFPSNNSNVQNGGTKIANFKPSPQVDTYYEYNRFPVVPALPEAKHFSGLNLQPKPIRSETLHWLDNSSPLPNKPPWYNKVIFPMANSFFNTKEKESQPFPYLFSPEVTTQTQTRNYLDPTRSNFNDPTTTTEVYPQTGASFFGNFGAFGNQPTFNNPPGGSYNKGSSMNDGGLLSKTYYDQGSYPVTSPDWLSSSPWKKIIKFMAALIPIGLLISALTPTIINVSPGNSTYARGRSEDIKNLEESLGYLSKFTSTIKGCEERIMCELIMTARTSTNAEQHIQNLLESFTEQNQNADNYQELQRIVTAFKTGSCGTLTCRNIKKSGDNDRVIA